MGPEGGAELIVFTAIVQCLHRPGHLFFFYRRRCTSQVRLAKICVVY